MACGWLPLASGQESGQESGQDGGSESGSSNGEESSETTTSDASEDGERVHGVAYTDTNIPINIDDPDEDTLHLSDPRPGDETISYDGTYAYDLKQGPRPDDKHKYAATDYIHWTANGATLKATGQLHDTDSAEAARVSSQAWGAQMVEVKVTLEEGTHGSISAENRIGFRVFYYISGSRILEASVVLHGSCVDINGRTHTYDLADSKAESLEEMIANTHEIAWRVSSTSRVEVAAGSRGSAAAAGNETQIALAGDERLEVSSRRMFVSATTGNDSKSLEPIRDSVTGATPLNKTYKVYSMGRAALSARGGGTDQPGGTTVVILDEFLIQNALRVFKKAESLNVGPASEPQGTGGGGTGPAGSGSGGSGGGGSGGGGSGGGDPDGSGSADSGSGGSDEGADSDQEAPDPSELPRTFQRPGRSPTGSNRVEARQSLDGLVGLEGLMLRVLASAPIGLASERGSVPGELQVFLSEPAPRDLIFSIVSDPPGSLLYLCGETITIRAGQLAAGGPLDSSASGAATVSLHLLDEQGELSGCELVVPVETRSLTEIPLPEIYATAEGAPWRAGAGTTIVGVRAQQAPSLVIGRLGFDEFATQPTTLTLTIIDPDGVLPALPAELTIPPDESELRIPLLLNDVAGQARVQIASGDREVEVTVVSRTQELSGVPLIRVPLGAQAFVPIRLAWPERQGRSFRVTLLPATESDAGEPAGEPEGEQSASPVHLAEDDSVAFLPAGLRHWAVAVRGVSIGRARLRFESEGLDAFDAFVEVTPARVSMTQSEIRISSLPTGTSGAIQISAPDGVRFGDVAIPAEAAEYVEVSGSGTGRLTLTIVASPNLPESLVLGTELVGTVEEQATFAIYESLAEDAPLPSTNNYHLSLAEDSGNG